MSALVGVTVAAAIESEPSTKLVQCPDCDEKGRMKCPQCKGMGILTRVCPTCDGKGRRDCKSCVDNANAAEPGRLRCKLCGGSGTTGELGQRCSKCDGRGARACPSCLGQGDHRCPKKIHDKVCPTCRFAGRIHCTTCDGTRRIDPATLARRRAAALRKATDKTDSAASKSSRHSTSDHAAHARVRAADSSDEAAEPPIRSIRQKFARVATSYDAHLTVFADDRRPEVEYVLDAARAQRKKIQSTSSPELTKLADRLITLEKRIRRFATRFDRLYDMFRDERRTYLTAERIWQRFDESAAGSSRSRERAVEEFNTRLRVTTNVAEKKANLMVEFGAEGLLVEVKEIGLEWKELRRLSEAEHALYLKEEALTRAKNEYAKRTKSSPASSRPAKVKLASATTESAGSSEDLASEVRKRTRRRVDAETRRESKRKKKRNAKEKGNRSAKDDTPAESSGAGLATILAAILGFGAACGAFFLRGYLRGRS